NIGTAANRVETTMAGLLTLVISFLARIAGLGRVSDAVVNIINRVRAPIDRALDRVIDWIVNMARRVGRFFAQAGTPSNPQQRLDEAMVMALSAVGRFSGRRVGAVVLRPILAAIKLRYGLKSLEPVVRGNKWAVQGEINPIKIGLTPIEVEDVSAGRVTQPQREELQRKVEEQKSAYREKLNQGSWRQHLGWCFERAVELGIHALAELQGVEVFLIEITPQEGLQNVRPVEGRTVSGERDPNVNWRQHFVVTVNGRVFDSEFNVQGLNLSTYLSRMFPNQRVRLRRAQRESILAASIALTQTSTGGGG
ncbi:MAG: hypothetical protein LC746_18935, partial [Acidobacteria bacterium]|nr:hypothetical protein [Acidobacteriota bacterium]